MAIDTLRARGARWAAMAAFALATLSVIGRARSTPLPPPRGTSRAPAAAPTSAPAEPAARARADAPAARSGPRGLSCAALSVVLPGAGQIHGGARARGAAMVGVAVALLIGALVLARQDVVFLVGQALRPEVLLGALALNGAVLAFRGGAVADAWRLGSRPARRAARAALLAGLLAVVAVPHAVAAWYQWSAYDAVTTIFADVDPADIPSGLPFGGTDGLEQDKLQALQARARAEAAAAWPPGGRLTVLLLGGDAGPGRLGLRTDTMVVATIHARTRRAALLSLPRNMGAVPLPPAAAGLVPDGRFPDILNALYGWARRYPDRFPGRDPGATALKQVAANLTGLRVDYYALVDFRGFVEMVDALGGVTIDVPRPVLDRVSPPEDGQEWIRIDLQPGRQTLTALEAFAYVRARSYSSDYERIRRQRCVMVALARQADPARVLRAFPRLARAARQNVSTDIPRRVLPELVELVAGIDQRKVVSLGFVPPVYSAGWVGRGYPVPDIPAIRAATRKAIGPGGVRGATTLGGEVCA